MTDNLAHFLSVLSQGILPTVQATIGGIILATAMSFLAGLAALSRLRVVRIVARIYIEGLRGTSEVVQLFWIYFALPLLVGIQMVPIWAGILVLGLNHGAYGAEIVRGAVQSVPKTQYEGATALNLTAAQRMRRVILPQAVVEMLPSFNNLFIQLLKASSLLSLITVTEITYQGKTILTPQFTGQTLWIYGIMLVLYLVLSIVITLGMRWIERRASAMVGRRPPKRTKMFARTSTVGVG